MNYKEKAAKAAELRAEAYKLEKQSHQERPLPISWKVGQKIRYLNSKDWAWNAGETAYVNRVRGEYKNLPASVYQVFYTGKMDGGATFWTTPDDVELVEDVT